MQDQFSWGYEAPSGEPASGTVEIWPVLPEGQVPNYGPYVAELVDGRFSIDVYPNEV